MCALCSRITISVGTRCPWWSLCARHCTNVPLDLFSRQYVCCERKYESLSYVLEHAHRLRFGCSCMQCWFWHLHLVGRERAARCPLCCMLDESTQAPQPQAGWGPSALGTATGTIPTLTFTVSRNSAIGNRNYTSIVGYSNPDDSPTLTRLQRTSCRKLAFRRLLLLRLLAVAAGPRTSPRITPIPPDAISAARGVTAELMKCM